MPTNLFSQEKTPFRLLYMFFDPPTQIVILERLILRRAKVAKFDCRTLARKASVRQIPQKIQTILFHL